MFEDATRTARPGLPTVFDREVEMMAWRLRERGLVSPVEVEAFEDDETSDGYERTVEVAAELLVDAMTDLRDSDLSTDEIAELLVAKINESETPTCEATCADAVEIVGEIEKGLDEDVVIDIDTGYDESTEQ